jgi:hypothetical protein
MHKDYQRKYLLLEERYWWFVKKAKNHLYNFNKLINNFFDKIVILRKIKL